MSADSAAPANIMIAIDPPHSGANANSSEEMMPLPHWKDPSNAAAVPAIAGSTEFKAAAFVQAATTPFMPNTKNTMTTTPPQANHTGHASGSKRHTRHSGDQGGDLEDAAQAVGLYPPLAESGQTITPIMFMPNSRP